MHSVAIEASKLMLSRIIESCRRGESFQLESTLSGQAYLRLIPNWKSLGYSVILHSLRLPSVDLAIKRTRKVAPLIDHVCTRNKQLTL
jgi:predicted ABC-type ATPase